jgi:hypothetical protein
MQEFGDTQTLLNAGPIELLLPKGSVGKRVCW